MAGPRQMGGCRVVVLIVAGLAAVTLGLFRSGAAHATVTNLIAADASGDPSDVFADTDQLWAFATADLGGGKICVSPVTSEPATAHCLYGNALASNANLDLVPISEAPLPPGRFVLFAENDPAKTSDNVISEPFTVEQCLECPHVIGVGAGTASDAFKQKTKEIRSVASTVCTALTAVAILQAAAPALEYMTDFIPEAGAPIGIAIGEATAASMKFAVSAFVLPADLGLGPLGWVLQADCLATTAIDLWVGDPPDSNYQTIAAPVFHPVAASGYPLADEFYVTFDRQEAYATAMLHSYERYQGAWQPEMRASYTPKPRRFRMTHLH
jgi:hypothetical protein